MTTATRGYIRIRTPDDKPGQWTAMGDLVPGVPYTYVSGDVAVMVDWPKPRGIPDDAWPSPGYLTPEPATDPDTHEGANE